MVPVKVYLITNSNNDKVYVGYTSQKYVSSRMHGHRYRALSGADTHLYRAMRKYGSHTFSWSILGEYSIKEEAQHAEKLWIILLRANESDFGYNTTRGGEAPCHTEETKRKISRIQKENPKPKEFYKRLVSLSKTAENRKKQGISLAKAWAKGKFSRQRGDNHWTKRLPISEETRQKHSEGMRRAWKRRKEKCP